MNEHLDEVYLDWLVAQVTSSRQRGPNAVRTYYKLLKLFHDTEFFWLVANDDNRILDGLELRNEFIHETGYPLDEDDEVWASAGCSVLEMLIGLSRRLSDLDDGEPRVWFWKMVRNLGLDQFDDQIEFDPFEVEEALSTFIYRTYKRDGTGGLFPLKHAKENQRKMELWYQLNLYLMEQE